MARQSQRNYQTQMPGAAPRDNQQGEALAGLGDDDATIDIAGESHPLNEVVNSAFETTGMSVSEWNALTGVERDARVQAQIAEIESITAQMAGRGVPMTRAPQKPAAKKPAAAPRGDRLPEPHEVDPDKITAPTRTTKGWIIPSKPIRVPKRGE